MSANFGSRLISPRWSAQSAFIVYKGELGWRLTVPCPENDVQIRIRRPLGEAADLYSGISIADQLLGQQLRRAAELQQYASLRRCTSDQTTPQQQRATGSAVASCRRKPSSCRAAFIAGVRCR